MAGDGTDGTAPGQLGGERRRALREERTYGRRSAHAAPRPDAASPATPVLPQPAVAPPAAAQHTTGQHTTGQHAAQVALGPALPAAHLPSRRDRAALRRPSPLDEAAVLAGDTTAWKSFPALSDAPTRSALSTAPAPLTRALARSITEHLDAPAAPMVPAFVPRRRPAPAVSGPIDVVAPAAAPVAPPEPSREPSREPSWTTGPVSTRRSRREAELPPPPPAAEVEALLRERDLRSAGTSSSSVLVPTTSLLGAPGPVAPAQAPQPTSPLTPTDLAALRTAAATSATTPLAPASRTADRTTDRASRTPGRAPARATGRAATRPAGRATGGGSAPASATTSTSPSSAPATRHARSGPAAARRWHQRRALGLPVGLLAAAAALVVAVAVGAVSPEARQPFTALLTAATGSGATADPAPVSTTDPAPSSPAEAAAPAGDAGADEAGGAADADASAGAGSGASEPAEAPAAEATTPGAAPSAPAAEATTAPTASATALIPTGDITYEGFGTAANTYVELGTADSHETSTDLGSTFTRTMEGSAGWTGWYVGVNSQDGTGTVGCRIKDGDRVLVEKEVQAQPQPGKALALCILGSPPGVKG